MKTRNKSGKRADVKAFVPYANIKVPQITSSEDAVITVALSLRFRLPPKVVQAVKKARPAIRIAGPIKNEYSIPSSSSFLFR